MIWDDRDESHRSNLPLAQEILISMKFRPLKIRASKIVMTVRDFMSYFLLLWFTNNKSSFVRFELEYHSVCFIWMLFIRLGIGLNQEITVI